MAVDKLVDSTQLDADLTSIANAIRTKGGTSAQLAFPAGFVSAVEAIPTGGDTHEVARKILDGTITEYVDDTLTYSRSYAFYNCANLEKFICHNIGSGTLQHAFDGVTKLKAIALPKFSAGGYTLAYNGYLEAIDLAGIAGLGYGIATSMFRDCAKLKYLIIRADTVKSLANVNAFTNTPFASGKAGGTLYVPASLVSSYQSASNWSTIFGYGSGAQNSIKSIESTHTDPDAFIDLTLYYADGTSIST